MKPTKNISLRRAASGLGLLLLAALLAGGLLPGRAVQAAAVTWPALSLQKITAGVSLPVSITHADDHSLRTYIVEQGGTVRILLNRAVLAAPFLDIHTLISCCGERGLLGLAFPPNYAARGHFYVYYTNLNGDITIARYNVSADPNLADAASGVVVLTIPHPTYTNHNGGQLAFGPDGYLYAGTGDGGSGGDPLGHGQSLATRLGKLLRIDVEGAGCVQNPPAPQNYCIPASNPFRLTAGAMPEIWSLGLRNPWRFSFDRLNGDLYLADVGQAVEEEIDFRPANSAGAENYGWNVLEGNQCYSPSSGCVPPPGYVAPVATYDHVVNGVSNGCSVTGGYVYRGPNIFLNMQGVYFYGDFCKGTIYGLKNSGGWQTSLLMTAPFMISTFGEDEAGFIYVADYNGGVIYQLTAAIDYAALPFKSMLPLVGR